MKKQFSLKLATRTMIIALAILLTASLVSGTATINVYLDDLPASATYTIKTDGTNYWAVRYDGYKVCESTNASYVFGSALANASTNGGGTVLARAGTYTLTNDIIMYDNTALEGEGWDSTVLVNARATATGFTSGLIKNEHIHQGYGDPPATWVKDYNITIGNLRMDGKRATGKAGFAIAFSHADSVYIHNVKLQNFAADSINFNGLSYNQGGRGQGNGTSYNVICKTISIQNSGIDGIAFNGVFDFVISDYTVHGFSQLGSGTNNGHAITFAASSAHGTVSNVVAQDSINVTNDGAHGVALFGAKDISFSNGWIYNVQGNGFHAESTGSNNPMDISLSNWHVINATMNGYYFKNGYYETVSNVEALNSGYGTTDSYDNFRLYNTDRSIFSNLLMRDNQATHSTRLGFNANGGCDYNIVTSLLIYGCSNSTGYDFEGANSNSTMTIKAP